MSVAIAMKENDYQKLCDAIENLKGEDKNLYHDLQLLLSPDRFLLSYIVSGSSEKYRVLYWKDFVWLIGKAADFLMNFVRSLEHYQFIIANNSWDKGHIEENKGDLDLIYPQSSIHLPESRLKYFYDMQMQEEDGTWTSIWDEAMEEVKAVNAEEAFKALDPREVKAYTHTYCVNDKDVEIYPPLNNVFRMVNMDDETDYKTFKSDGITYDENNAPWLEYM